MTNRDIQLQAARIAAEDTTFGVKRDPAEVWHAWSQESGVHDAGARLLFEQEYATCRQHALWRQLLSATSWGRMFDLVLR